MYLNSWPPQKHQGQLATVGGCGDKTVQVRRIKLVLGVDCYFPQDHLVYISPLQENLLGEGDRLLGHTLHATGRGFLTRWRYWCMSGHDGDLQNCPSALGGGGGGQAIQTAR